MSQTDALIRFFFKQDPCKMNGVEYLEVAAQMWWALEATGTIKKENGKITFLKM